MSRQALAKNLTSSYLLKLHHKKIIVYRSILDGYSAQPFDSMVKLPKFGCLEQTLLHQLEDRLGD